jgi:inner membrane protein
VLQHTRRRVALGCLGAILLADHVIRRRNPPWLVAGMFDEPAHLATAGLLLLNLQPRSELWSAGFMAGALLPDVDHIPLALQPVHPAPEDPRPVSHCLLAVAPVAALAAARRSGPLAGAAAGMLAHFVRDLAVGTGVPLAWPATARAAKVPYPLYLTACVLLTQRALRGGARAEEALL